MAATASEVKHRYKPLYAGNVYLTEAVLWVVGLVALAFMEPTGEHLFSLCPWSWVGLSFCPGCGLGHAIAFLARGEWLASWEAHPLALPAMVILVWRVAVLLRQFLYFKSISLNHRHTLHG